MCKEKDKYSLMILEVVPLHNLQTRGAETAYPLGTPMSTRRFCGNSVTKSLVCFLCSAFVILCSSFCPYSLSHWFDHPSSIYEFILLLWYVQTFLSKV